MKEDTVSLYGVLDAVNRERFASKQLGDNRWVSNTLVSLPPPTSRSTRSTSCNGHPLSVDRWGSSPPPDTVANYQPSP